MFGIKKGETKLHHVFIKRNCQTAKLSERMFYHENCVRIQCYFIYFYSYLSEWKVPVMETQRKCELIRIQPRKCLCVYYYTRRQRWISIFTISVAYFVLIEYKYACMYLKLALGLKSKLN